MDRKRGRPLGSQHDDKTRLKIKTSQILNRLTNHILAKPEIEDGKLVLKGAMVQSQVTAALGLLKKTLPDLQAMTIQADVTHSNESELTDVQLSNIATSGSNRITQEKTGKAKVH